MQLCFSPDGLKYENNGQQVVTANGIQLVTDDMYRSSLVSSTKGTGDASSITVEEYEEHRSTMNPLHQSALRVQRAFQSS